MGGLGLLFLIFQYGFPLGSFVSQVLDWLELLLALGFATDLALALFQRTWRRVLGARRFEYLLLGLFLALLALVWSLSPAVLQGLLRFLHLDSTGALAFSLMKVFLLCAVLVQLLRATQRLISQGVRPELVLAGSFAVLILIGALLLLLPNASARPDRTMSVIDALFTSTSAACVTGLAVRDTGSEFSLFGQMIILVLFQVGGLGIITFVAFLSVFSARTLPVPQMVAFQQMVNAPALSDLKRQILGILLATGLIELAGAGLLYQFFPGDADPLARIKWSVFHSVSAFCNAGFALQADSLVPYQSHVGMNFTFMLLIVLGGLGFLTLSELVAYRFTRAPFFRRLGFFRRLHAGRVPGRLSVQTKMSLTVMLVLLAVGLVVFWVLEFNHLLREHSLGDSLLMAAFQSVTPRTAGFNTVPIQELRDATLVFLMMLMVVGANPVSTGGGIKTVSFGILLLALRAMIVRRERVEAFGRAIPAKTLFAALSVFVIYVIAAGLGIFLLALFDPGMKLRDQAFEVISALSTVGLSTGITADLSPASKLVLCAAMFVGRVGPISLVLSVIQSRRSLAYDLPEEEVVVG